MYISGSTEEIKSVLLTARSLRASAIHFLSPNVVFIVAKNKEDYVYARTSLNVAQSVLVPNTSFQNMYLYMKSVKRGYSNPLSPFYLERVESASFVPGKILFNDTERLAVEVDLPSLPLKKEVELKVKDTIQSSYDLEHPYIRITNEDVRIIESEMNKYKKRYFYKTQNASDNAIRIEDEQLILYFEHDGQRVRIETGIEQYAVHPDYRDRFYYFTDRSLYLLLWLSRTAKIENFILIPREGHCLIEGHAESLAAKARTALRNDFPDG